MKKMAPSSNDNEATDSDWAEPSQELSEIAAAFDTEVENVFPESETAASPFEMNSSNHWQDSFFRRPISKARARRRP